MKHTRLAFITEIYLDSELISGGIKLNYILLDELFKQGYSIDLFCSTSELITKPFFNNIFDISEFESRKNDYDLILSDKAFAPSDITYIHDHSYPYRTQMMSTKISHSIYKIFNCKTHFRRWNEYITTKRNILNTKIVIVSSNILKKDMIDNYGVNPDNIRILPPPIENYSNTEKQNNKIFTFGISTTGFVRKGGYITLKAIKDLKKLTKNFKVKFIYPSSNLFVKLLLKLYRIEKYCEFIPAQEDMSVFYNSIDCLLMPSIIEPFGMVATEALSLGCPVITATHCGASDIIIDGKNGYLYKNNTPEELSNTMYKMLKTNPTTMQNNCMDSVKNLYAKDFVENFNIIINELLSIKSEVN